MVFCYNKPMSNNNKPTYTMSGSYNYTVKDVANAIRNVAGNIINPMSSSGILYAPYVPLQTSSIFIPSITTKSILNVLLNSNSTIEKKYKIILALKYQFLTNHIKVLENIKQPQIHEFKIGDILFISEIVEINDEFHAYPVSGKYTSDYLIETISLDSNNNKFIFKDKEFVHMLDNQVLVNL